MSDPRIDTVTGVELGLGLIGIGRPWPTDAHPVSSPDRAFALLDRALELGIRFLDTAAAYGASECVLGEYLRNLSADRRARLLVATKCGESWSAEDGSVVDHSVPALQASLDRSTALLGDIDLLQLHKCTGADFLDDALLGWLEAVKKDGRVGAIGISVSSVDALTRALDCELVDAVQFPGNTANTVLTDVFAGGQRDCLPIVNRPMASGALVGDPAAFDFHAARFRRAVVLTGTTDPAHLVANERAFAEALARTTS
ncbi:MAG TPA: aldo/keto reductase [Jatrophihabitantaceae bacterium]|jgi:aryl-alcohol dehydrogenase-like predicted oxidoreductase